VTRPRGFTKILTAVVGAAVLVAVPMTVPAAAQDRPAPVAEFSIGWVGFADDGIVSEFHIGGDARFYLGRRISVGPELGYIQGDSHSHFVMTGNLTWDVVASTGGKPPAVTPFIVVGAGLFQTRESSGNYTHNEGAFTAGGGVRANAGDRVVVGVDVRVGWETHVRITGFVGVRLGR
jgi:hypothetical protein